jgi:hypothetical protein
MLAARDRAGSAAARAAIRRDSSTTPEAEAGAGAAAPVAATPSAAALDLDADTLERLRAAKRRARGG